jgi:hypothetical protein
MNVPQVIRKIRQHRPETLEDFKVLNIPLIREGAGIFRVAYHVKGLPLLVKFPIDNDTTGGRAHSASEVRKIRKLRRFRWMRSYLPTIYFYDRRSGVLVLSWHAEFANDRDAFVALGALCTRTIKNSTGVLVSDIHEDNVRKGDQRRKIILIDLGY